MSPTANGTRAREWRVVCVTASSSGVPARPGLYALGHCDEFEGLESGRTYVYIGRANNLRRRFEEHSVQNEPKPGLQDYIRKNQDKAKFWFTTEVEPDSRDLGILERCLIDRFKPRYNDKF